MNKRILLEATLLRALCTKQLNMDEVLQVLDNFQVVEDNRPKIERKFAGKWVGAVGGRIYTGASLADVHDQMITEHPDEKGYAEQVGAEPDIV